MPTMGAFAAKTHFSQLLDRVEQGESITILRHGKAVAQLTPVAPAAARPMAEILSDLLEIRRRHKLPAGAIREMIHEGRRY